MSLGPVQLTPSITTSVGQLTVAPTDGMAEDLMVRQSNQRTRGGRLESYKQVGDQYRYSIPVTFINSATRTEITSWWLAETELWLTVSSESLHVYIANNAHPLPSRSTAQFDKFSGVLRMHQTRDESKIAGLPLIVDDAVQGELDSIYFTP